MGRTFVVNAATAVAHDRPRVAQRLGRRLRWYDCTPTVVWHDQSEAAAAAVAEILAILEADVPVLAALNPPTGAATDGDVLIVALGVVADRVAGQLANAHPVAPGEMVRIDGDRVRWRCMYDDDAPRPAR